MPLQWWYFHFIYRKINITIVTLCYSDLDVYFQALVEKYHREKENCISSTISFSIFSPNNFLDIHELLVGQMITRPPLWMFVLAITLYVYKYIYITVLLTFQWKILLIYQISFYYLDARHSFSIVEIFIFLYNLHEKNYIVSVRRVYEVNGLTLLSLEFQKHFFFPFCNYITRQFDISFFSWNFKLFNELFTNERI